MTRVLLVDNYDSFTYNLAQLLGSLGAEVMVVRNDATVSELAETKPDAVVVSPGPGTPSEAGVSEEAITFFGPRLPVLGVCLGHQCIATAFGAVVERAAVGPRHGKLAHISHDGNGLFADLPSPFEATRYHSLAVDDSSLPESLVTTARSKDSTIMGIRHKELPVYGVQFHPESILCSDGPRLLANFLHSEARLPTA